MMPTSNLAKEAFLRKLLLRFPKNSYHSYSINNDRIIVFGYGIRRIFDSVDDAVAWAESATKHYKEIIAKDFCRNCEKHPATIDYVGYGGLLEVLHGANGERWCECCVTKEQLKYAREMEAKVGELEKKLAGACRSSD